MRTPSLILVLALAGAVLLAGCSPREARAQKGSGNNTADARSAWNWEAYPPVKQMRLGTMPCQLLPKSTINVMSPLAGLLHVYITAPQTNLPAGFLWAEFEPEIFAAEEKSIEESLRKLEDQEKLQWEIEYPRKKMQVKQQIEEAERQVNFLRYLSTNSAAAEVVLSIGDKATPLRPESLREAEMALELSRRAADYLESTNFASIGIDLAGQRTDWERRKLDYERRRAQSRFEMPFDGKLTVSVPLTEGVVNYPVSIGQELGVARDISSIRVRVVMENVSWSALPMSRLRAVVRSAGAPLTARFAYQKIERVQNREESACYFEFAPEDAERAARLIGANVSCELWMDMAEPVRIVPKMAVILHRPDAFQNRNWASALAETLPGTRLVVEGQTDLAVVAPKQEKAVQVSSAR